MAVDKALNMISLAMKARALVSGEFACEQAIKDGSGILCRWRALRSQRRA